jgi:hypothetical protein
MAIAPFPIRSRIGLKRLNARKRDLGFNVTRTAWPPPHFEMAAALSSSLPDLKPSASALMDNNLQSALCALTMTDRMCNEQNVQF